MKMPINEEYLIKVVKKAVTEELNKPYMYDMWHRLEKYHITEGLTMTYSAKRVVNLLQRRYDAKKLGMTVTYLDNNPNSSRIATPAARKTTDSDNWYHLNVMLNRGVGDNSSIIKDLMHTCDACGWYFSDGVYYIRNGMSQDIMVKNAGTIDLDDKTLRNTPLQLKFRAKFNAEYKPESIPPFLYHVCPSRVVPKILKQGLTPRNNGRIASHPERVYLFLEYPDNWKMDIARNFKVSGRDEEYTLLEVDTRKLKNVRFYYDSNTMRRYPAIYTNEPITPDAITVLEEEK